MKYYTLQHTGYPVAGRCICDDEWSDLSRHSSITASDKRVNKLCEHLQAGSLQPDFYIPEFCQIVFPFHEVNLTVYFSGVYRAIKSPAT